MKTSMLKLLEYDSEQASLFEGHKRTIFINRLECAATQFEAQELSQFRHPDALGLEIGADGAQHDFGDVAADPALFLGQTRTVDSAAGADAGSSNTANTCHDEIMWGCGARRMATADHPSRRILPPA